MTEQTLRILAESETSVLPPEEPTAREIRAVFIGLMIVLGLGAVDQSVVATALPRIVGDLGGIYQLSWVVTAYLLASTTAMPLYGRLSDQYGRKPLIYGAITIFLLGSALSGTAQSLTQLIIFRAIQGLGAGGFLPLSQIIIGDLVPPAKRGSRQGAIVAVFAVCSVLGPVIGGVITDWLSWHWIFYVNLPTGALAFVVIGRSLRRPNPTLVRPNDYLGVALLTCCTILFLLILTLGGSEWPWFSPQIGGLSAAAVFGTALFVLHLRRVPEPVLPLDLFDNRLFVVANIVMTLTFMGMLGGSLLLPLFFQIVMGISASDSGLLTGLQMIGVVVSSVVNGRVLLRWGRYKPAQTAGLAVASVTLAVLAWEVGTEQRIATIGSSLFVLGLGFGLVMPNMSVAVQNALPVIHRGVGTATLAFFRSLGGVVGVASAGAILAQHLNASNGTSVGVDAASGSNTEGLSLVLSQSPESHAALISICRHAIATTLCVSACIVVVAFVAVLFLPELPLRAHGGTANRPPDAR
ncbi:MDR family MFS transporter [Bradyrhizobium sp. BR 10261]|uniref:MDR family MFS transporter n=1 Tax=Bradyrhizobium sp. BR 10261 TaxID=2749992 RepID=UPI001C646B03|nr:MDR family MFS transporter [Bradyrhizobium sp. BR 10261]MBW7967159.1 MFS transporter [Bradyrhizobium sp. BR 10261]